MRLIVWLGNPGKEYEITRHNAGFLMINLLRETWNFPDWMDSKHKWVISEWIFAWEKTILLKPTTYMNLSGESVASLANFYKIPVENILVISDDIDMEFGKVRYRDKGSSGGQNGLKSIAWQLGTENFSRIKIGIGRDPRYSTADWVLSKFQTSEIDTLATDIFIEVRKLIDKSIFDNINLLPKQKS